MNEMSFRTILAPIIGAVLCFAVSPLAGMAGRAPVLEQFAGRAVGVSGTEDTGPIGIYIERWSSDEELDGLAGALMRGETSRLLQVLQQQRRRAGVLLLPGVQGRGSRVRERTPKNLLFAREINTPGGRRLIVASDQHLGLGESQLEARKEAYEFNVIDIRFGPDGTGIGKVATAAEVVYDPATKGLQVKDYATKPARLVKVKADAH